MRTTLKLVACLAIALTALLATGCPKPQPIGNTEKLYNTFCDTFDRNYSYFSYKGIDWDDLVEAYRPLFQEELTADKFAEETADMLQLLHDWHVWVRKPGGAYLGYEGDYEINHPNQLFNRYTASGYTNLGDVIYHAWIGLGATKNVAYIAVDTLDSNAWSGVSDGAIGNMFVAYKDATGMIVDIRANAGGNENNAVKIASRLTYTPRVYGYTKTRNGPRHTDFDPLVTKTLQSSTGMHFDGPVVCLIGRRCMSSAEWFTLMMRACPNVTLMGDWTRGASGNPATYSLSNGVSYSVSRWIAYTDDMEVIEDNGIAPDEYIPAELSFDSTHDFVLEEALEYLEARGD